MRGCVLYINDVGAAILKRLAHICESVAQEKNDVFFFNLTGLRVVDAFSLLLWSKMLKSSCFAAYFGKSKNSFRNKCLADIFSML